MCVYFEHLFCWYVQSCCQLPLGTCTSVSFAVYQETSSCMQPYTLQHLCSLLSSCIEVQFRKVVDPWLADWIHSECVAWFVLQEFPVCLVWYFFSPVCCIGSSFPRSYQCLLYIIGYSVARMTYLEESVSHYFYLYTQWVIKYFSHMQSCIHKQKQLKDIYTLTLLACLRVNSIVQQIEHVFQCVHRLRSSL